MYDVLIIPFASSLFTSCELRMYRCNFSCHMIQSPMPPLLQV